jgi:cytochrome c-type biogenesis protein CcmH
VTKISSFPRRREPSKAKTWVSAFAGMTLFLALPAIADSGLPAARWANEQLPDPRQEAQAKALMEELRCLVCQGQSIADSNAELAGDMRAMVRQRIAGGEKPEQVRAWLIQRYGNWVSYRPPVEPVTWPLWATPILLLLAGAWLLRKRLVRRRA